jgi:phage terminase small subunit
VAQTLQGVIACANHPQKDVSSRQHAFLKAYAKGKTLKQAAIEAGYSKKNADQSGYQVLKAIKGSMVNENKKRLVE